MKKKKLLKILLLCLYIISCKKNEGGQPNMPLRVKAETDAGGSMLYTYNAAHNIVKAEFDNGFKKLEYLYEPGKIMHTIVEADHTYIIHYSLNEKGYVSNQQFEGETEKRFYEYNGNDFLIRTFNDQTPRWESNYHYNASTGLLDSIRSTVGDTWSGTSVFLYYTDKANSLGDENFGRYFFGKSSQHPVKSVASRRPEGNLVKVSVTNFTYTYDSRGRISSRGFTTSGGQSGNTTYTYYE
ncbi:hypothetical protein [Pseudobacter ginsenosidimutans]|uniref:YD repeat-containing protein n=1 Tax=Pseudobacter ginsenosidimutans TaxID=661488 RepID=A0A4Q7N305_9BACT|nr:hypothetical protein [Pseudobacter ginsenosidimutans]QEC43997.1 hypothetical protein FSB84_20805 [Pseudobacter ginsenosidimutans]RZS75434.1 hypothetical protein EV199_1300 [Pseudobacter ginsenosidimutans]